MDERTAVGIDVGGTKVLGVVVRLGEGPPEVIATHREATPEGARGIVEVLDRVLSALERTGGTGWEGVGVGVAGHLDLSGVVRQAANTPGVIGVDLAAELQRRHPRSAIRIENDANCWALAAWRIDAPGAESLVAVTLGTGIGGGMVLDGRVYRGAGGMAGEWGHMVVAEGGPLCACGARGCWEALASGTALDRLVTEASRAGEIEWGVSSPSGRDLGPALGAGAPGADPLLRTFAARVALGVGNIVQAMDPEVVVLGGGPSALGEPLREAVEAELARSTVGWGFRGCRLLIASAGPSAGAVGAALSALA